MHESELLETSLEAVSMLCYARQTRRDGLMQSATLTYSLALSKAQEALDATAQATQDHVLASVMLLALYAALSADSANASTAWTKHIYGALAVAAIRPRESFKSLAAQKLLSHVISSIQLDCVQRRERIPAQLRLLYDVAMPGGSFYLRFCNLIESLAELRAAAAKDHFRRTSTPGKVLELDREAGILLDLMPFSENFDIVKEANGEVYHVYSGHRSAQAWNTLRLARLALMELMPPDDAFTYVDASREFSLLDSRPSSVVASTIGDICHSVPRFLRPTQRAESQPDSNSWIYSLIWPLAQSLASPFISRQLHERVLNQLLHFSNISKDPQIGTAARMLCQGEAAHDWYVQPLHWWTRSLIMLGSTSCTFAK
jgi:hypothetical protein